VKFKTTDQDRKALRGGQVWGPITDTTLQALLDDLDAAQAQIAELERERDHFKEWSAAVDQKCDDFIKDNARLIRTAHDARTRAETLSRELDEARKALERLTPWLQHDGCEPDACTCGLDAALAASRAEEKP